MTKEQLLALQNKAESQIALADRRDIDGIRGSKVTSANYTQYQPEEDLLFNPTLGLYNLFAVNPIEVLYNSYMAMEYMVDSGGVGASELQEGECPGVCDGVSTFSALIPMGALGCGDKSTYENLRNRLNSRSRTPQEDARKYLNTMIRKAVTSIEIGINKKLWNGAVPTGTYALGGVTNQKRYGLVGLLAQHKAVNDITTPSNFSYNLTNIPAGTAGITTFVNDLYEKHVDAVSRHNVTKAICLVPRGGSNIDGLNEELELRFGNNINFVVAIETFATRQTLIEAIKDGNLFSLFPTRNAGFKNSDFMIVECDEMLPTEAYYYPIEVNGESTCVHYSFYLGDNDTQNPIKLSAAVSNESYLTEFPELGSMVKDFDRVASTECRTIQLFSMWEGIFQFKAVGLGKYWNDVNIFPTAGGLALPKYKNGDMTNTTAVV